MDDRAQAVGHRIGHDAVDSRVLRDRVIAVEIAHLPPADLARCEHPVFVKGRERKGSPAAADKDPGGHPDVTHAQPHGRNPG